MSLAIDLAISSMPMVTTGGDSTCADPPPYADTADSGDAVDDNALLPPTILVLAGQTIHGESAAAAPLYQLNRGVANLTHATSAVTLARIERAVRHQSADAADNTTIKQRVRHIYDLRHMRRAPGGVELLPSDAPRFFIKAASHRHTIGHIGLKKARFRARWQALPVGGVEADKPINERGLPQFRKYATPLFTVRRVRGRYEWSSSYEEDEKTGQDTDLHAVAVEDEGEGQHRLVVTATLRCTQLDALVALWCCRIWETSAELQPRLHEGMEGVRRKFRLAGDLPR